MRITLVLLLILLSVAGFAQNIDSDTTPVYKAIDSVTITALGRQAIVNIPYSIQRVELSNLAKTPSRQMMLDLMKLPSISSINQGISVNKPVIRGLSFNHVQLFAQGTRFDNQTWDDRHDIGISDNGFDKVEIVNGPAALVYGPNTMGGAMVFSETPAAVGEKSGFAQLGFFSNSVGINFNAGYKAGKENLYYSINAGYQMHTNYVQGGQKPDTVDKLLAFNSKFTTVALKGMVGIRKEKRQHQLTYNVYQQFIGIIEDEALEAINNPAKAEERDYEMEAPYQDVQTHVVSLENRFQTNANSELNVNVGYQFNRRNENEPDSAGPKRGFLAIGLNLSTITGDVQWVTGKSKALGFAIGVQGFNQKNENTGAWVLVPDANVSTVGAFVTSHYTKGKWNFLAGVRIDAHNIETFETIAKRPDTLNPPFTRPDQELSRDFKPFSFSIGVVYHATPEVSIKLNAASGYTAPNYAQLTSFGRHEGTFRFEIGDNSLNMEQNVEADLTVQWETKTVSASLNGYVNSINNYIYLTPTNNTIGPMRVFNWVQHDAKISGLELNLQIHPANSVFEGYINGGVIRGKLTDGQGDLPYIPANKLITGLTWKNNDAKKWMNPYVTFQVGCYGSQDNVARYEETTAGYVLTDIYFGVKPPFGKKQRWSAVLFCNNVFNIGYFNHLSLIKSINVREPGRNFGIQMKYDF